MTEPTQSAELVTEAERLAALARARSTDPAAAAAIGQVLSVQFGLWYLYAAVVTGSPVEQREVRRSRNSPGSPRGHSRTRSPPGSR
ncbi:hypothetical protein V2I01_26415 [Micromonospora sp. BRA006-A]|nr:hypothetical protein [Micromonospora sp. BRA006-A]